MTSKSSRSLYNHIFNQLREKETGELLEIWQENNRNEWSDEAFLAIHEILRDRLGSEPPEQGRPSAEETSERRFRKVVSLSDSLNYTAWVLLLGFIVAWFSSILTVANTVQSFFGLLPILLQGVFFFYVLRFLSQALNLLIEIVKNTGLLHKLP